MGHQGSVIKFDLNRTSKKFESKCLEIVPKLLSWSQQFREVVFLENNDNANGFGGHQKILAVDALTSMQTDSQNAFAKLDEYQKTTRDYLFGYLTYDLKNDTEILQSKNPDTLSFPDLFFFQPKKLFFISENDVEFRYLNFCDNEIDKDWEEILQCVLHENLLESKIEIKARTSKEEYVNRVGEMLHEIHIGNIYEANYCINYLAENAEIEPLQKFFELNKISLPPFAAFLKCSKHFALCASPERFLQKAGQRIISQPIKGTARRSAGSVEDEAIKIELQNSKKERSENIMIVDLVRNDLSKTAEKGSVKVTELCGLHTFKQVHHLISTVESVPKEEFSPVEIIKSCFPMGSMTGAPKISAMQIIENLEDFRRGLYSGAIGYFDPNGDFDFNVVIRSILYNSDTKVLSYSVGSAITSLSNPESEYEECILKANAMKKVLES